MKKLSLICAALLIAGCGSGSSTYTTPTPTPTPSEPLAAMLDAFSAAISGLVSAAPDDTEAGNIDALVATAPEDSEPAPL